MTSYLFISAFIAITSVFHENHGSPTHGFMPNRDTEWETWNQNKRPIFQLSDGSKENITGDLHLNNRIAKNVDWRTKGVVNPVRNQGQLGSAAAMVAADAVASYHAIHTGTLNLLSNQEVIDCCSWSLNKRLQYTSKLSVPQIVDEVFSCIHNISGLCEKTSYKPDPSGKCLNDSCAVVAKVPHGSKFVVPSGDESALAVAVSMTPVFALVDASHPSFQFYTSGIYDDPDCSQTVLDHVLLVVGFGTSDEGEEYWICQNSWGVSWGMQGYILLARNKGNRCGLATHASYPY